MRVLHIVGSLSVEWGGLSRAVAGLCAALSRLGVEVEIVSTTRDREESLRPSGTRVESFRAGRLARWGFAAGMRQAIEQAVQWADLVHLHGLWLYPHLVASRRAWRTGRSYVVSPHGMLDAWALNHKRVRKWLYAYLIEWPTLARATAIHAVTNREAADVRRLGFHTETFVVPNGIDAAEFADLPARAAFGQAGRPGPKMIVLLFLGRVHPKKGVENLVKAFSWIAEDRGDVLLMIAGPDSERYSARLQDMLVGNPGRERCLFTGMLRGEERLRALAGADIFVLPSYSEGFPVAVLEAMAAGVPVVVSDAADVPGLSEWRAGLVVRPEPRYLCEALQALIENPVRRREMGTLGRELVVANYTWDRIATQMLTVYARLLARAGVAAGGPITPTPRLSAWQDRR